MAVPWWALQRCNYKQIIDKLGILDSILKIQEIPKFFK